MKLKLIISAVPLLAVLGCGSDNGMFTLSSGTYALSSTAPVAPDNCNVAVPFHDGITIQLTVSGSSATFIFGAPDPTHNPVSTIQGNTLGSGTKTYDFDNSTLGQGQSFNCVETITQTVNNGSILANDQLSATLLYNSVAKSGTQCAPQYFTSYKTEPCSSTMTFHAKKQ